MSKYRLPNFVSHLKKLKVNNDLQILYTCINWIFTKSVLKEKIIFTLKLRTQILSKEKTDGSGSAITSWKVTFKNK